MLLRSFVVGSLFLLASSALAEVPPGSQPEAQNEKKCFNAAEWIGACIDRQKKGDEVRSTLVDVAFPGEKHLPLSNNWILKNFESLKAGGFKFEEDSRMTQEGCKTLSSKDSTLNITGSSEHHLDLTISPDTLTKGKGGLEVILISTLLANFKMKMQEIANEPESLRLELSQITDNQLVQSTYVIRCGGKTPELEKVSDAVIALTARHDKLVADGVKVDDKAEEERELAYITKTGQLIYVQGKDDEAKKEYEDAWQAYAKSKGKIVKELEPEATLQLQAEFLKEKGRELSKDARYTAFNELRFARLLLNPKDEAKLVESEPKLKGKLKELRAAVLENQKLIATQLDMPDAYWNYPDVANDVLEKFAEAIGKALGEAVEKMGEGIIEGLKKLPAPPPPGPQEVL